MFTLRQIASVPLSALLLSVLQPAGLPSPVPQHNTEQSDAKRAQKAAEAGDKAAAAGRLQEALVAYEEAVRLAPQETAFVERSAALRSRLVRSHVEAAERLALASQLGPATEELAAALRIDPGNAIVAERLAELKTMQDEPATKENEEIPGLPKLQPQPGRHDLDLRGDTKAVYEQLAATFGVKVAFDPDLAPRNARLHLDNVDFYTAISVLSTQTGTFWRPLNPTLFFVAQDSPEKRRDYGMEAEQTFALSSAVGPEDATEILRILRDITGATRIGLDTRSRTITMRDSPEKLALARELIQQIDRARGEVMLEIELLEVDRNKARQLGVSTPTSTNLIPLTVNDIDKLKTSTTLPNLLTNLAQVFTAKGLTPTTSVFPFGGGLSTFLLTLPSTAADFSDLLSLVQSGRQVLLRAQDGKPATFFVGDRFPITLSLLSGSLGTGASSSGTSALTGTVFPETQFTVSNNPSALVANTFTGGTLPDLAVVFNDANDHTFTILQNQDNGNFVVFTPQPITLGPNETGQVAIGTGVFRSDTTKFSTAQPPDVVLVNSTSNNISVLLGNVDANGRANGTFTEAQGSPFAVGKNPSSVVLADFNGDGFLDIAVANRGDNSISVFKGNGDGTFTPFPGSPFRLTNSATIEESSPVAIVSANFQNKVINTSTNAPEVDLAIVNQASNNVTILLSSVDQNNNVAFTEAQGSPISVGTSPVAIATGDLNADGVPDLAVVNEGDNSVSILLGSSNVPGTFTEASGSPLQTSANPAGIVIANFVNATAPDIAVTNKGANTLGVYLGQGQGTFASRIELNTPTAPSALITSTLTTSGLPDVALVATGAVANQGVVAVIQDSTSFASSTSGSVGVGQIPYPGSEYVDLGVKIKATPTLHPDNQVTLQLEFEIRSLSGSSVNGIPIISNRTLTQTVRVKEDEPTLIGGLTDLEETRTITGLPGFAEIPGAGYALGVKSNSLQDTELLIVVTPRKLRLADRLSKTIFAGRGDIGPGRGAPAPGIVQPPTRQPPP